MTVSRVALLWIMLLFGVTSLAAAQEAGGNADGNAQRDDQAASKRPTVGVIARSDFMPDRTQLYKADHIGLPTELADEIMEHLANSRRFRVVERKALRRVVMEQRPGSELESSFLGRTLDKAIETLEEVEGGSVKGQSLGGEWVFCSP